MARDGNSKAAFSALERLCQDYWRPVYAFIRREGYGPADAQELTQEFLSRFVHKDWLNHLKDQRGKFRSFLLTFLKHFLSDYRDHVGRLKRGGGAIIVPLEALETEESSVWGATDELTAEETFDLRWAHEVMERTVTQLRREFVDSGKAELYELLKDLQPGERAVAGYAKIGAKIGLSEGAVKSAVHRLRLRHRALLRAEIARTVIDETEVDAEIRHLIRVLGGG